MSQKPVIINIMLGTACNWSCPYCLQHKQAGFDKKKDPEQFCDKLLHYLDKNNITQLSRICYWGGEPLLYMDYVSTIERRLKHIPITRHSNRVITNGSLIDDNFIEFANQNNVLVNLSYHQGQLTDAQWEKALHIRQLYVTSLVNHTDMTWEPYFKKWNYIYKTFGRCINWYIHPSRATPGVPEQFWITKQDLDWYFEYLTSLIPKAYNNVFYNRMFQILFFNLKNNDYGFNIKNNCYNETVLSIDMSGNRYFCHHDCSIENQIGNIFDDTVDETRLPTNLNNMGEKCNNCPVFPSCMGGCFRDLTPEVTCEYNIRMYQFCTNLVKNHPKLLPQQYFDMVNYNAV